MILWKYFLLACPYAIQAHNFDIWYGTNCSDIMSILGVHFCVHIWSMLAHFIAWVEFPFLTLFITIYGLGFYKSSRVPILIHNNYLWCIPKPLRGEEMDNVYCSITNVLFETLAHSPPNRNYTFLHYFTGSCKTM